MVKLCYTFPLVCVCVLPTLALSTEYVKHNSRQVVLSKPNQEYIKKSYSLIEPHLQKRNPSYRVVKTKVSSVTKKNDDIVEDEEFEEDETAVNSYSFRSLQKKLGLGGKKFEMPISGPVPDWDDQYYDNDGKPIVYQVDTEELKELMDNYLEMGKEKWAAFLATSECNKFQKLMDKLHNLFKKNENADDHDEDDNEDDEDSKAQGPFGKYENDADDEEDNDDDDRSSRNNKKVSSAANKLSLKDLKGLKNVNSQPLFSSIPEEEIEEFHNLLADVVSYWEEEDAISILEAASGLSYKDFDLFEEDENPKKKKTAKRIKPSLSVIDDNDDDDDDDDEGDDDDGDINANVNDDDDENDDNNEIKQHQSSQPDLLGKIDPKLLKTKAQKDWLKSNALRRANMIQKLMDGQLDEENYSRQDEVRYRENNIFLEEDENEIPNTAFRLQSTNLAMYVFFLVEALLFYVF